MWDNTPIDPSIKSMVVMGDRVVTKGSRVRHYNQSYTGSATATVVGFFPDPDTRSSLMKVRVKPDRDHSFGNTWDADRTEVASDPKP